MGGTSRSFYGLSHNAMVWDYVFSSAHNCNLAPKFATSFTLPTLRHKGLVWHSVFSTTRQVIQTDGLAFGSSPLTMARRAQTIMPQSFCPLNTEEECTLLVRGEETITPQAARASNFCVRGVHVH